MECKPILFNEDMVKAILKGRKTQTRRVMKPQPYQRHRWKDNENYTMESKVIDCQDGVYASFSHWCYNETDLGNNQMLKFKYGHVGDRLWVRETFSYYRAFGEKIMPDAPIIYKADADSCGQYPCNLNDKLVYVNQRTPWKSSIHMPRWASRITLEITDIRVERVQDITEEDAIREGCNPMVTNIKTTSSSMSADMHHIYINGVCEGTTAKDEFHSLWNKIYEKRGYGWLKNPWVWVIEFRRVENE